jgi:transposase
VFSGLSPLVVEAVADEGERIRVRARTPDGEVSCPDCCAVTARVHAYCRRFVDDVALDARRVRVMVRVRRLICPTYGCCQTFREQVPSVLERYQRRTARLAGQVGVVVTELAGRAGVRVLSSLAAPLSRHTAIRMLRRVPAPRCGFRGCWWSTIPRCVADCAYATILIDAETRRRIDVLPGRSADSLEAWLRANPGVEVVCRDGSGAYAEAVRREPCQLASAIFGQSWSRRLRSRSCDLCTAIGRAMRR